MQKQTGRKDVGRCDLLSPWKCHFDLSLQSAQWGCWSTASCWTGSEERCWKAWSSSLVSVVLYDGDNCFYGGFSRMFFHLSGSVSWWVLFCFFFLLLIGEDVDAQHFVVVGHRSYLFSPWVVLISIVSLTGSTTTGDPCPVTQARPLTGVTSWQRLDQLWFGNPYAGHVSCRSLTVRVDGVFTPFNIM